MAGRERKKPERLVEVAVTPKKVIKKKTGGKAAASKTKSPAKKTATKKAKVRSFSF